MDHYLVETRTPLHFGRLRGISGFHTTGDAWRDQDLWHMVAKWLGELRHFIEKRMQSVRMEV